MLDHEPIFGKNVIETLSEGMYDNPLFLFREYVQNSADAIDAAVRLGILREGEGQIEIVINDDTITFEDNGTGIPHDGVKSILSNIGNSQKDRRTDKGFRGIGRLGGLGYCQKVRFETSSKGESIKSILEWDARNLHEILINKNEKIDAGQLIKRITSTWEDECGKEKHFFKVSLINVKKESTELLDKEEVRRYLAMVAPVPFDYAKFPFVKKIEKFIADKKIPSLHEYHLNLNGDEIRKGYETPLGVSDGKMIDILDVECRPVYVNEKIVGWYWFCVSKFEGVLPKKCWQRNIRLRKSNIQIGEADCLSNHPKRGDALWREDRGNNYFIGEIHALDENLIPNSRRDYFNQDDACRQFEEALQEEFLNLHQLYHEASAIRSASSALDAAEAARENFEKKDRKGEFYDPTEREKEAEKVSIAFKKAKTAQRTIEKIKEQVATKAQTNESSLPITHLLDSYVGGESLTLIDSPVVSKNLKNGFVKDDLSKKTREILDIVFDVLGEMFSESVVAPIRSEILRRVMPK